MSEAFKLMHAKELNDLIEVLSTKFSITLTYQEIFKFMG